MITADQEAELALKVIEGDPVATEKLVKSNLRFVISVAKQYQNQGLPLSDLISEGNLGLIKAAHKFDPTKGFRFISYAVHWVKQSIIQSLSVMNFPTCGSLNEKINEDGDEVLDITPDNSFIRPDEDVYCDEVLKSELNNTLSILSDRERKIIEMYFGMDGGSLTLILIGFGK